MSRKIVGTYGHGTENDFVLIFDPEDKESISPEEVARICNRKTGIGADGLVRIIKRDGNWFMDYRNSDGSLAETCGNALRLIARYLVDRGHQSAGIFSIDTRGGMRFLKCPESGDISVNMGQVALIDGEISAATETGSWSGLNIEVGNPHAVLFVDSVSEIGELKSAPKVSPENAYPEGTNVEFVERLPNGELKMRVFERGVGETRSCGSGTCAVALAATAKSGRKLPTNWVIHAPGGRLEVEIDAHSNAILSGPAVVVREVELEPFLG